MERPLQRWGGLSHISPRLVAYRAMAAARRAVDVILAGHEPCPALVAANRSVALLLDGVAPELLAEPLTVLKVALHPSGLAGRTSDPRDLLPGRRGHGGSVAGGKPGFRMKRRPLG